MKYKRKHFKNNGGNYRCRLCKRINDSKEDSDICSSCEAERYAMQVEMKLDTLREIQTVENNEEAYD